MAGGRVPFDSQGTGLLPKLPMRPYVRDYLTHKKIIDPSFKTNSDVFLRDHLISQVKTFAQAVAEKDEETLFNVAEPKFAGKVKSQFGELSDFTYEAPQEKEETESYISDRLFIKGVNTDREANGSNWDY